MNLQTSNKPLTILTAGFQHETNTFAPSKATYQNFAQGEGHPALARGNDFLDLESVNLPIGGFLSAAKDKGWKIIPTVWAGACPSAHVTHDAFERICAEILDHVSNESYDAIFLDLHGAMVAELYDDGEGELLRRIREVVGAETPIVASLDLHANVTEAMIHYADGLIAYRTYPHVDMADTGRRSAELLDSILNDPARPSKFALRLPFLIPVNSMCTLTEPAKGIFESLVELETNGILSVSFATGFPASDFPECGPVIWGYGIDERSITHVITNFYSYLLNSEPQWRMPLLEPKEAVEEAVRLSASLGAGPVVIADTQDNPGGGADSNTAGMLRALVDAKATNAAIGLYYDPDIASACHKGGIGSLLELTFGGKCGIAEDIPFTGIFEVLALSDGRCQYEGPMKHGMIAELGPMACVRIYDIYIAISSTKAQMLDRALYRAVGIKPETMSILVNKSSVHFRADFDSIARATLIAKAPGPMTADPADLPWKNLGEGMRLSPGGKVFIKS